MLFMVLPTRRAVIAAFLIAWMFLPVYGYDVPFLPAYTKMSATCMGVLLGMLVADRDKALWQFRFNWLDLPMLGWCICPFFSSITNGLGPYDGLTGILARVIEWGLPYFIARVYFTKPQHVRELAIGLFIGGLVYVPLCLWEVRMSPQLHKVFYGYYQHVFVQTLRGGGYRPMVFMNHGLMVGMFMATSTLIAAWLWISKTLRQFWVLPMWLVVLVMAGTTVLCKSTGATALMMFGIMMLFACRTLRNAWLIYAMILVIPLYLGARTIVQWDGGQLVGLAQAAFGEDRASSLKYRLDAEVLISGRTLQRPLFGWGGWNRSRVFLSEDSIEDRNTRVTTDSLWIIAFGQNGFLGLASLTAMLLLPTFLVFRHFPPARFASPMGGPLIALAMVCLLYMLDCLVNAMVNPIFLLALGACVSMLAERRHATAPVAAAAGNRKLEAHANS